ncbi:MAG TPA: hypothetical protein VKP52_00065 [Pseudolabrys sp.]|nr:hypothetical protein [Pseudolabrys sp.]
MRHRTILLAALSVPAALALTQRPYDPYRWCAAYSGKGGGGSRASAH